MLTHRNLFVFVLVALVAIVGLTVGCAGTTVNVPPPQPQIVVSVDAQTTGNVVTLRIAVSQADAAVRVAFGDGSSANNVTGKVDHSYAPGRYKVEAWADKGGYLQGYAVTFVDITTSAQPAETSRPAPRAPATPVPPAPVAPPAASSLRCPTSSDLQSLGKVEQWVYEQNQLAGAQLSFNQDFGPGNVPWGQAVDGIHQNGAPVPSVKAGTQATVWIVPACRPLR